MLSLLHPWLLLLAPLPWLVWRLMPPRRARAHALRVPFGARIEQAIAISPLTGRDGSKHSRTVIQILVWLLVLVALARPQWTEEPVETRMPTRDLLLLVDLSGSMEHEDFTNREGKPVSRLDAVKDIVGDFLEQREGDRVGLVVFGEAPFLQSPFSTDLSLARRLLDETAVGMAGPRTAFGDGIGLAISLFEHSDAPAKTVIALTDGNDTHSQVPPVEAARIAADRDIRIHTVAIGDAATVGEEQLDLQALEGVARTTGGKSFFAANREELAGIYDELEQIESREVMTHSHRPRRDLFHWPILGALALSLVARIPRRRDGHLSARSERPLRVHPLTGELELH